MNKKQVIFLLLFLTFKVQASDENREAMKSVLNCLNEFLPHLGAQGFHNKSQEYQSLTIHYVALEEPDSTKMLDFQRNAQVNAWRMAFFKVRLSDLQTILQFSNFIENCKKESGGKTVAVFLTLDDYWRMFNDLPVGSSFHLSHERL